MTAYQPTPLADALPGMVLSEELRDAKGNVLLAEGVVLTETMLASLARHGIDALPILHAEAPPALPDPAVVRARLERLFRNNRRDDQDDWASATLRRYVQDYRLHGSTGTLAAAMPAAARSEEGGAA